MTFPIEKLEYLKNQGQSLSNIYTKTLLCNVVNKNYIVVHNPDHFIENADTTLDEKNFYVPVIGTDIEQNFEEQLNKSTCLPRLCDFATEFKIEKHNNNADAILQIAGNYYKDINGIFLITEVDFLPFISMQGYTIELHNVKKLFYKGFNCCDDEDRKKVGSYYYRL